MSDLSETLKLDGLVLSMETNCLNLTSVNGAILKVGLSPSKKISVICFIEGPLKIMKNTFYFILKALFVLKIFKPFSWLFGHVEKTTWLERQG